MYQVQWGEFSINKADKDILSEGNIRELVWEESESLQED